MTRYKGFRTINSLDDTNPYPASPTDSYTNDPAEARPVDPTNPHPRLMICLVLDTSASMRGHPINELNAGVRLFYETVKGKNEARYSADISIITFGNQGVKCVRGFAQLYELPDPPSLSANGMTPMGEAVNMALDMIETRRKAYRAAGVQHYHPWMVIMSDGMPNGDEAEEARASKRSCALVNDGRLVVFPIGIGREADRQSLAQFSPKITPRKLTGLNFTEFFEWLGKSVHGVSVSRPGDKVGLPPVNWGTDGGWGAI